LISLAGASRVASGLLCVHAIAITPAGSMELVRSSVSIDCGLPCDKARSAPATVFSGPAQRFTHVTACTLAESPSDPFHRKLRQLRCLRCRFDCYRVERTSSRAGVTPAEVQAPFTAHFIVNYRMLTVCSFRLRRRCLLGNSAGQWHPIFQGDGCTVGCDFVSVIT
jgi:hypothetical protein